MKKPARAGFFVLAVVASTKKPGLSRLFRSCSEAYFLSDFVSLGEAGVVALELDEPAMPLPVAEEPVAPMPEVELDASAPVEGVADGAVVVVVVLLLDEGEDADDGEDAGGVVTVFSSFLLHAVRPIATRATTRSERFMFFPLGVHHTELGW